MKTKSDNGFRFDESDIRRCMQKMAIEYTTSAPLWSQGNSEVESLMKPLKKVILTLIVEASGITEIIVNRYGSTPHTKAKVSLVESLFKRKMATSRDKVSDRNKEAAENNIRVIFCKNHPNSPYL